MSDRPQIAPEQPLSVTLAAAQWNAVMAMLQEGPYRVVQPLIAEINRQCVAQADAAMLRVVGGRDDG